MGWLIIGLIIFLSLLFLAANRINTKYYHSIRSLSVMGIEGAVSLCVAVVISVRTGTSGLALYLLTLAVAIPLFLAMATITLEIWRKLKQIEYDSALKALQRQEASCLEKIAELEGSIQLLPPGVRGFVGQERDSAGGGGQSGAGEGKSAQDRKRSLETFLEEWQSAEGLARLRSLKLQEWEGDFNSLDSARLLQKVNELKRSLESHSDCEQLKAQVVLGELILLRRGLSAEARREDSPSPFAGRSAAQKDVRSIDREIAEMRVELERIRRELEDWRRRREEFSRGRIRLD